MPVTSFRRLLLVAAGAGLAGGASIGLAVSPAMAAQQNVLVTGERLVEELPTRTVSFADLNLASPSGKDRLNSRVIRAISSLCPIDGHIGLREEALARECRADAWKSARPQLASAFARARLNNGIAAAAAAITISTAAR